jgi:RimJ/RimL family protein N-acetyltransferase
MDYSSELLWDPSTDVRLVAMEEFHIPLFLPLFQDIASLRLYLPALARPMSEMQLRGMLSDWNDASSSFVFTILHEGKVSGLVNLESVDWTNRSAETGIAILPGEHRGKGVASSAMRLLLRFIFREMGLHRLQARIQDGNDASHHLFESLGFHREGTMREAVLRSGIRKDLHLYSILSTEFLD